MVKNMIYVKIVLLLVFVFSAYLVSAKDNTAASGKKIVKLGNRLDLITGNDSNRKSYYLRIKAVNTLGNSLQPAEISAIYQFLHKKLSEDCLTPIEFNAIKNELVRVLMKQKVRQENLVPQLIDMYNDKSFDDVWRDYCIQFIGQLYPKIRDEKLKEKARKACFSGLKELQNGIAGTSLIALSRLTGQPGIDKNEISEYAITLLEDKNCPDIIKISALQVGANLQNSEILPIAKEILEKSSNVPLKSSAIAAIGILRDRSEIPRLEKYRKSSDVRIRSAATGALKRIKKQNP